MHISRNLQPLFRKSLDFSSLGIDLNDQPLIIVESDVAIQISFDSEPVFIDKFRSALLILH